MQPLQHVVGGGEQFAPLLHLEIAGFRNAGFVRCRQTGCGPGIEAAVQHMNILVSEEFQEPEKACRSHSGDVVVDDDGAVGVHAFGLNQVFDDPQEGLQRLRAGVDQADAEDIEASRARNVTVGVGFRRPQVHDDEPWVRSAAQQLIHRP